MTKNKICTTKTSHVLNIKGLWGYVGQRNQRYKDNLQRGKGVNEDFTRNKNIQENNDYQKEIGITYKDTLLQVRVS